MEFNEKLQEGLAMYQNIELGNGIADWIIDNLLELGEII